ncbi:glycerophosphodiester phosphodiesterase family protein [Aquirufa sp. 5-AUSEE-100C1]
MKFIVGLLFISSSIMAQIPFIQGHRGCRGLYPENSIPAFEHALNLGVRVLEMDVCLSADGQVVVSHESYMNARYASHPSGNPVLKEEESRLNLYQMPYSEIKRFDVGSRGNASFPEQKKVSTYKPLLSEVLALGETFRKKTGEAIYYNIEIKSEPSEYGHSQPASIKDFSDRVQRVIRAHVANPFIILQSFDFAVLAYYHQVYPEVRLSALVESESPQYTLDVLGFTPAIFSSSYQYLTPEMIQFCHSKGMQVVPWTINSTEKMQQFEAWGVDGIITDYPNRAPKIR